MGEGQRLRSTFCACMYVVLCVLCLLSPPLLPLITLLSARRNPSSGQVNTHYIYIYTHTHTHTHWVWLRCLFRNLLEYYRATARHFLLCCDIYIYICPLRSSFTDPITAGLDRQFVHTRNCSSGHSLEGETHSISFMVHARTHARTHTHTHTHTHMEHWVWQIRTARIEWGRAARLCCVLGTLLSPPQALCNTSLSEK